MKRREKKLSGYRHLVRYKKKLTQPAKYEKL